ncbi:MAG TPA: universal stress protein [Vicinamibacterales bacterium]|nr:universal stress protein [Vicinamibacterales bacterium]
MAEITRILCPIDLSPASERALEHAVALARWYEATLVAFHVFSPQPLPMATEFGGYVPAPPQLSEAEVIEEVRQFTKPVAGSAPIEIVVRDGHPVYEIIGQAAQMRADLLVLGTHGRSGFERLFLGSVTEKVVRKVACPTLTVPPHDKVPADPVSFKKILCPVDFSPPSTRALEYAVSLAKEADARLMVLHVLESYVDAVKLSEVSQFTVPEFEEHRKADAVERLRAMIPANAREWCTPEELVITGKPHREIVRVAADTAADLIVMGVHGRGAVDLMVFGSATNEVLRAASCPVLTLRT